MVYRVAGILNKNNEQVQAGFIQFEVTGKTWAYELRAKRDYTLNDEWKQQLSNASALPADAYLQLHAAYGKLLGNYALQFITQEELQYQVQLIASPGLHVFQNNAYALGDGAAVAAITGINTVSDYKTMDAALGGTNQTIAFEHLLPVITANEFDLICTAFFAVLRWREENNMMRTQTGALRNSIGGAVWIGQEW
ncbi:MAG: anhydro-N-acetylmuramic acid kinase [Chitinophagaceae bacterium]|nr:anhydro-N-acetylmuramic acid kinase [Chitinophagaceae bacterium]